MRRTDPLIKWPGGKSSELRYVRPLVPSFSRYVEPFFGGGALFFEIAPRNAVINDISNELMLFYRFIQSANPEFGRHLNAYAHYWSCIPEYLGRFGEGLTGLYSTYRSGQLHLSDLEGRTSDLFRGQSVHFKGVFEKDFCVDRDALLRSIEDSVVAKMKRMRESVDTQQRFSGREIRKNVETAFRGGFYVHFREVLNRANRGELKLSDEKRIANYYFVREFCYGSMFRFNSRGDFNIPYGGIAYNTKDFGRKVNLALSPQVRKSLGGAVIENMDFEKLFEKHRLTEADFVFVDPPYDSDFSSYGAHAFTREDHERLAGALFQTRARFLLLIKNTPFIRGLYDRRRFTMASFEKRYLYNVRGRNDRNTQHLLITNYAIGMDAVSARLKTHHPEALVTPP